MLPDQVVDYLIGRGLIGEDEPAEVSELDGGVSCSVLAVRTPTASLVVKEALPQLRVSATWLADPGRAATEATALALLRTITPESLPLLLDTDESHHVLTMTKAPDHWQSWKTQLLGGFVDLDVAAQLGSVLASWHRGTQDSSALSARFVDLTGFYELRLDPFHYAVAAKHPAYAPLIEAVVEDLLASRRCLVHGDFSPKNVLVGDGRVWVVDFEVAHYGDPTFDLAFLLTHLLLKTAHLPDRRAALDACGQAFLAGYRAGGPPEVHDERLLPQIGCLLVARVDGTSPAGYLPEDQRDVVRELGLALLRRDVPDLHSAFLVAATSS